MGVMLSLITITVIPFLFLFTQTRVVGSFSYAFGNIAGFIGAVLMLWEFVLGIREIARKIAPNPALFMKLHIILGVWGMFFVLIHPILEMFSYAAKITFLFVPDISTPFALYVSLGRIAFFLVVLLWLTSSFLRSKVSYKVWFYFHLLSYPLLFLVFIHAILAGSFLQTFPLIRIYWILLFVLYIILVLWRIGLAVTTSIHEHQKK